MYQLSHLSHLPCILYHFDDVTCSNEALELCYGFAQTAFPAFRKYKGKYKGLKSRFLTVYLIILKTNFGPNMIIL